MVSVRTETPADVQAIEEIIRAAFHVYPGMGEPEVAILEALRASGDLALSLVALEADVLVGHAAFSPVRIDGRDEVWFGLGPVSVRPDGQGRGIGSKLIQDGLDCLRKRGAAGCVVLGDADYYRRFGFVFDGGLSWPPVGSDHLGAISFSAGRPRGLAHYAPAFGGA